MAIQINKQITVKGQFNRAVIVNDTFVNGYECVYDNNQSSTYSHAEGYKSNASGMYSHADGVKAQSDKNYSFVWSGINPESTISPTSKGVGTFCIYTNGYDTSSATTSANGLSQVYINGKSLTEIENHYKQDTINTLRTSNNTFTQSLYLSGTGDSTLTLASNRALSALGKSYFKNSVEFTNLPQYITNTDISTSRSDNSMATCRFVHDVVQEYFKNILGDSVFDFNRTE